MKCLPFAAALLLVPAVAFASGDDLFAQKLGIQIGDFLVVMVPLIIVLIPVVRRSLVKKHEDVKASLDAARAEYEACSARLKAAEEQLSRVTEQMESIKDSFRTLAETERKALETEAMVTAEKLRKEADMRINHAGLMVRAELADEVVSQALAMVEKRLVDRHLPGVSEDAINQITGEGR